MEKRWDAYLAVALDGDDVEIQVDGHAGEISRRSRLWRWLT